MRASMFKRYSAGSWRSISLNKQTITGRQRHSHCACTEHGAAEERCAAEECAGAAKTIPAQKSPGGISKQPLPEGHVL